MLQKINTGIFSNTYSGSSGGFVRARKTQFTKIVKSTKISKYLWISVKENNWVVNEMREKEQKNHTKVKYFKKANILKGGKKLLIK